MCGPQKSIIKKLREVLKYSFVHFSVLKNDPRQTSVDEILLIDGKNLMSEHRSTSG